MKNYPILIYLIIILFLASPLFFSRIQASNSKSVAELMHPYNQSSRPSIKEINGYQKNTNLPWPMCCHDPRHTGLSQYNTSDSPAVMKWRLKTDWVDGGIAIDNNGILYFGSNDRYMNAIYPNGTMKWRHLVGDWIETTPTIGVDGTIYAGCWNGYLYAFYPDGSLKWSHWCGADISYGSPVIADDGTIYVTTLDGGNSLVAINFNGTEKWHYQTGQWLTSAPALGLDGTIYFGSTDTYIYAVNQNGTLRWRYKTGDYVMGSASIAEDGTVYIGSWDGYLYSLNPINGSLVWRCRIGDGSKANPAIGPDGTIYIGEGYLFAVAPNGTVRWKFPVGGSIEWSSPAISADGIIYFGTHIGDGQGGDIITVNPNGTERWRQRIANYWVDSSPAIGSDGTVYIGCAYNMGGGYLYAFGRGPLIVDAHGPYTGYYDNAINFVGDVYGGIPPYSYHWDFGDGSSSNQQNPTHNYTTVGNLTATFTVTDSEGNQSSDTALVSISYKPPNITITKPTNGIYLFNMRILLLPNRCIAIGPITIEAQASQVPLGIERVEFRLDNQLKATVTQPPYTWRWNLGFSRHIITVTAYDASGKSAQGSITVWKFF